LITVQELYTSATRYIFYAGCKKGVKQCLWILICMEKYLEYQYVCQSGL